MGEEAKKAARPFIDSILAFIQRKSKARFSSPYDGFILKMHYRWTFCLFLAGFFAVWSKWYYSDVIACVSQFNADVEVRKEYTNICLSYPYTEDESRNRTYFLYYRWVHWSFVIMAAIYYIPRRLSKSLKNPVLTEFLDEMIEKKHKERAELTYNFLKLTKGTHNGVYYRYILLNVYVLIMDIFAFCFYHAMLHDRFWGLGLESVPYYRDPQDFTDYISMTFPPFVWCELSEKNQMSSLRAEKLGCHLTFMEFYEKIFILLWYWIWTLMIVSAGYIIYLALFPLPIFQKKALDINLTKRPYRKYIKVGDAYILMRMRRYFPKQTYEELVENIFERKGSFKDGENTELLHKSHNFGS